MGGLVRYFRESRAELAKVVWPSRTVVLEGTQTVILFVIAFTLLLTAIDWVFGNLLRLIGVLPR